jgi:hypothetical protein
MFDTTEIGSVVIPISLCFRRPVVAPRRKWMRSRTSATSHVFVGDSAGNGITTDGNNIVISQLFGVQSVFGSTSAGRHAKFYLTRSARIGEHPCRVTSDMKKILVLSMLMSFAMICSCQKQDSAAEQQLAQRKTELDAREEALDEKEQALTAREQVLIGREKGLAEREKAILNTRSIPSVQGQTPDPAQVEAERDARIQQLPPEFQALIHDQSQLNSAKEEKNRLEQGQSAQTQNRPEQFQNNIQRKFEAMQKWQMSGAAGSPVGVISPTPSPAEEPGSAIPSPTPQ